MNRLILLVYLVWVIWLIRRDVARRDGISGAIWLPTVWVGILASRPRSAWVGVDQEYGAPVYEYSLEGSPIDRYFFLVIILSSLWVISRRKINWGQFITANWPLGLFYLYLFISVTWAESSIVSFKRGFKDIGNIWVALVILTEVNPWQAVRAVFVRCAYLLIPLSVIFIRYFPDLGRRYSIHSGMMEATGVTFQKNSLGAMVMICGVMIIWDWFERREQLGKKESWIEKYLPIGIILMGISLLITSDSKTSMLCLGIGGTIVAGTRIPFVRSYVGSLGRYAVVGILVLYLIDSQFGLKEFILDSLGRDATFTGRTDVWRVLLDLNTDPLIGTGFCSFWSDEFYRSQLPNWVAFSAHNGYLETYIDGGMIGVGVLAIMLLGTAANINRGLALKDHFAIVRFAFLLMTIIGNFSESHYGRIGPVWFVFLMCAIELPRYIPPTASVPPPEPIPVAA